MVAQAGQWSTQGFHFWGINNLTKFQPVIAYDISKCRYTGRPIAYPRNKLHCCTFTTAYWRLGAEASVVRRLNEVTVHWARLVLG